MAYKKEDLEKKAVAAIKKHNLVFIEEVVSYLPCATRTFYHKKLHELQSIKDALEQNKVSIKQELRKEWLKAGASATVQIALYKLLATPEELAALNSSKVELETGKTKIVIE